MNESIKTPPAKITKSWLCEKCAAEFKTDAEYKQHKVDHMLGKLTDKKIDPIAGPIEETSAQAPVVASTPQQKAQAPWNSGDVKPTPKLSDPIMLKYIYTGTCPCGAAIETIPLDIDVDKQKKYVVIAWCPVEKKNIQQRMVNKL